MLYFECDEGHFTSCRTGGRLFYCKDCKLILEKKNCEKYTDRKELTRPYKKSQRKVHEGKMLYRIPETSRRNYHGVRMRL